MLLSNSHQISHAKCKDQRKMFRNKWRQEESALNNKYFILSNQIKTKADKQKQISAT